MKAVLGAFKKPRVRESLSDSLGVTAGASQSIDNPSSDNSAGTSIASAQFLTYLGTALDDIEFKDDYKSQKLALERSLSSKIGQYSNVGLQRDGPLEEWRHTAPTLDIVRIALACSSHVYSDGNDIPDFGGYIFDLKHKIGASWNGVVKATTFHEVQDPQCDNDHLPALVIAIRGTRRKELVDWLVNFNQELRSTKELINYGQTIRQHGQAPVEAHAGFVNATKALLPAILKEINSYIDDKAERHVIFTGHSAGGAVASLAFAHAISNIISPPGKNLRFSLITFGAPPVTTQPLLLTEPRTKSSEPGLGLVLSIINEDDVVARLDHDYVESILRLLDTTDGRPLREVPQVIKTWPLPPSQLYHIGTLVLLVNDTVEKEPALRAVKVSAEQLGKSIFYELEPHSKKVYEQNLSILANCSYPSTLNDYQYIRQII